MPLYPCRTRPPCFYQVMRANEQAGLTAMHTLFMREHNRLADKIAAINPLFSGEEIYQQARKLLAQSCNRLPIMSSFQHCSDRHD